MYDLNMADEKAVAHQAVAENSPYKAAVPTMAAKPLPVKRDKDVVSCSGTADAAASAC